MKNSVNRNAFLPKPAFNLMVNFASLVLGFLLWANLARAATYVAVSTANGIDAYVVNGSTWTYDHQIIARTGLYGVTYNPSNGLLYACDTTTSGGTPQIFSIDPTNGTQVTLATRGTGTTGWSTSLPENISFGPDGKLYFSTAFGTAPNTSEGIFSMNLDGTGFTQFIARTNTTLHWGLDSSRDLTWAGTNLYVASRGNNNVYKFNADGTLSGTSAINSSACTGASSLYADTNAQVLYVGSNQSGVNSVRTLNIGETLPVAPAAATDSGGKVNSLSIIKVGGVLFYLTYNQGTSGHGSICRLNADKTTTVVLADLGATANDFFPMSDASTGPLEAVVLSVPRTNMIVGTFQQAAVQAQYLLINNDVTADPGTVYGSDNTNIITVSASGKLTAKGVGTANLVATFSGKSSTNAIAVIPLTTALIHRYGFTSDASDSVGTANGTLWYLYDTSFSYTNGGLSLTPSGQYDYTYVDFGANLISSNDAVTVEAWASFGTNYTWERLFDFGNNDGINGTSYIALTPHSSAGTTRVAFKTPTGGEIDLDAPALDNQTNAHIVVVFHPLAGYVKLYINGVLAAQNLNVSGQDLANVVDNYNYLGKSQFYTDPTANLACNELRIYSGVLDATNVAINYASGPDNLVSSPGALQSISLAINTNMLQQGQQTVVASGNFAGVSGVPLNNFSGVTFVSSDTNVLTVTSNGVIKAVGFGSATITVSYGGQSTTYSVTSAPLPQAAFLVAAQGNNAVFRYNAVGTNWTATGTFVSAGSGAFPWGTNGAVTPLTNPFALTQDPAGNVYVGEALNGGRVLKFTGNGRFVATLGTEGIDFTGIPDCLTFAGNGTLCLSTAFGTNATAHVLKYSAVSNTWNELVTQTAPPNGLTAPRGIAFDPAGNIYICNRGAFGATGRMVQMFDTNGTYLADFVTGITAPQAITYDATNSRFIVSVGATSLISVSTNGTTSSIATGVGANILDALCVGPNVFYSDWSGSGVYAVTSGSSGALVAGGLTNAGHIVLAQLPPNVSVAVSGGSVVIQWPYSLSAYNLQSTTSLSPANWQNVVATPTQIGNVMQVTLPVSDAGGFFRLSN